MLTIRYKLNITYFYDKVTKYKLDDNIGNDGNKYYIITETKSLLYCIWETINKLICILKIYIIFLRVLIYRHLKYIKRIDVSINVYINNTAEKCPEF